jgi:hypothetical protein
MRYQQPFPPITVVLQARTLGAELDYASVRLVFESNGTNVSLSADRIEMDRGTAQSFDLDLSSPQVSAYLQSALDSGNLRLVASSFVAANFQTGSPNYPQFYTRDNILAADSEVPLFDLEVAIADPSADIAPTLAIRRLPGGTVRVSWPALAQGNFILEVTATLSGSDWITVTNLVNTEAGVSFTDFEFGTAPAFFRLRRAP